jgi:hypothetical protein
VMHHRANLPASLAVTRGDSGEIHEWLAPELEGYRDTLWKKANPLGSA